MNSLEIVNKHIQFIGEHSTQIKGTPVMIDELQQIKQDLEEKEELKEKIFNLEQKLNAEESDYVQLESKFKGCLELIKELFNEIEIDCEPGYYTNKYGEEECEDVCTIKHNYHYFHITDELFDILYSLKKGYIKNKVGDNNE